MELLHENIKKQAIAHVLEKYGVTLSTVDLVPTKKEFVGDITLVAFSMLKLVKENPTDLCNSLGTYLCEAITEITSFTVVGGFLNLSLSDAALLDQFSEILNTASFGQLPATGHAVMVEYSSPNTNKPLHLGHVRNNVLGYSVAEILKAAGNEVIKTQIINYRGIHICKSMVAWKQYGDGETPSSSGMKGDHLFGKYYVIFDLKYREQQEELI